MHNLDERKMELSREFQLYAFDGDSGTPRWRNANTDFRKDLDELEQVLPYASSRRSIPTTGKSAPTAARHSCAPLMHVA